MTAELEKCDNDQVFMSELIGLFSRSNEPNIVELHFPDVWSEGLRRSPFKNPRSAWIDLAEQKGKELGIEFEARNTETGLAVAFLSQTDAQALLAAVIAEWKETVKNSLRYQVSAMFRLCTDQNRDPRPEIQRLAEMYDLDPAELAEVYEPAAELYR